MADSKEEIYSIMFSSLKHPARRKILRMLADKPMTFSEMLEYLGVSSSNLTYHLENLGELVAKDEKGIYKLSTFGLASVNTMKVVEEAPAIQPRRRMGLSLKWKTVLAALMVGLVVFASFAFIQLGMVSQLSSDRESLQSKYDQLLSWSSSTNEAISFLEDVAQIDVGKYQATLLGRTVEHRADLGGVVEEIMRYSLTSSESKLDVIFRFRNGQLSRYQISILEGSPIYSQGQPLSVLDTAKNLLGRLDAYEDTAYLADMSHMVALVQTAENIEIKQGNLKLNVTFNGDTAQFLWTYTEDGVDYSPKSLNLVFKNRALTELTDGMYLFTVGSTTVNISQDRAIEIAKDAAKTFSYTADGQTVSGLKVLESPVTAVFHPNTKQGTALYPAWYITLYLDKTYPGGVNSIAVTIWADNGETAQIKTT
jgi:DNA-binding transcriptional ArsR family regulator